MLLIPAILAVNLLLKMTYGCNVQLQELKTEQMRVISLNICKRRNNSRVLSTYVKETLLIILLFFPTYTVASDPRGLFWPMVIGLIFIGSFLFLITATLIFYWIDNKSQRSILLGFFFGLLLGPIRIPSGEFVPNIANLLMNVNIEGVLYAFVYACIYSAAIFILFFAFTKIKRK